ncbi:MAG: ParA family protein [Gammaproteobacteria bacterium]|nr:cobyrinic acid ac-diamide synthase [Gammaproteobacteria bacterium]
MQRIVVLNPKGGSGKTTIATNLAACFALRGRFPALLDLDPQASSTRWLRKRPPDAARIHGIAGYERSTSVTRSWQLRVPPECERLIVDTPAAIESRHMPELTRGADALLVPVMPSEIDIQAAAKCIADLLLVAKIRRADGRLGVIANRVRTNTRVAQSLLRFLESLDIPLVATFRDSQGYIRSAETGLGLLELKGPGATADGYAWDRLLAWLDARPPVLPSARVGVVSPLKATT